jgi:hypothetical protein
MAAPSFPAFHVTGAVHHYIRYPDTGPIYYLGTAEVTPKVEHRVFRSDAFNDIGGSAVPMQRTEQGEMAVVGTLMNRFSKTAYDVLMKLGSSGGAAGFRNRFSRGSLVFGPGSFELWQVFENATPAANAAGYRVDGLELGYYWPQVDLTGHTRDKLGTDVEHLLLVMECFPYWIPQASYNNVSGYERSWELYSRDDTAFPADVMIPQ